MKANLKDIIKALREIAVLATPGSWWIDSHGHTMISEKDHEIIFQPKEYHKKAIRHENGNLSHWRNDNDATWIATANPENVTRILDSYEELETNLKENLDLSAKRAIKIVELEYEILELKKQLYGPGCFISSLCGCSMTKKGNEFVFVSCSQHSSAIGVEYQSGEKCK